MKSTETYSVQRSMNNTRKLITSHYFVQYTFITERSCISQLSIRIMNHALRLASTVIKNKFAKHRRTQLYILTYSVKYSCKNIVPYYFFYKKTLYDGYFYSITFQIQTRGTQQYIVRNSTTRPGGNSMLIKHITDSGKMLMNHPRGVFERKNVGAFTMH